MTESGLTRGGWGGGRVQITKSRRGIFVGRVLHRGRKVEFVSVAKAILFFYFFIFTLIDQCEAVCMWVCFLTMRRVCVCYHLLTKYAGSAAHVLFIPVENDSKSRVESSGSAQSFFFFFSL